MKGGTLTVLMWKHFIVRKRRFIHTSVEILSTVILFIILFSFKKELVNPRNRQHEDVNIQLSDPIDLKSITGQDSIDTIYYTPSSELTNLLMNKVQESLTYTEIYTNAIKKPKLISYIDETEVNSNDIGEKTAFVIFPNISDTWPQKLNYTIRVMRDFKIYTYLPAESEPFRHEFYGTLYEPFMALQWAIDSNYLELLTGSKIKQKVTLQEFPYVKIQHDGMAKTIGGLLQFICLVSLLLFFVFLMARLLEERVSGLQELIKMVGVPNGMICLTHVLNAAPAGLVFSVVGTALTTCTSTPLLPNTNPFLVFLMLALYFTTVVAIAFVTSYVTNTTQYTETLAVVLYVVLYLPAHFTVLKAKATRFAFLVGLLPHAPMNWFWNDVLALQEYGQGLTFANMATAHSAYSISALKCYIFMIVQIVIYFGIAWYLSMVRPGPYGQPQNWKFCCTMEYWTQKKVTPGNSRSEEEELQEMTDENMEYFEKAPKDMDVGIKIVNVSKVYPQHHALKNVTLNVYKGEITVLLGHNGAGKTTLMSIITSMIPATDGKVYVEGYETVTQKNKMHKVLGMCPQHNMFFPELTVLEHVMFFALLKGATFKEAKQSSLDLLSQLGIQDKESNKSSELSGGMKRRLQLACALAGGSKVLVLDEPTSGLDVETRRELWDLLLSLRGSRTVLLSTHFMEEAEALGDRVATLHAGRLRCHATPMYLKRAIGTGYRVTFTTIGIPNEKSITEVIQTKIPEATVKESSLNTISYNLPSKSSKVFPKLFTLLESKKSELGIETIGVGVSTLEEVFLKLCSDVTTTFSDAIDEETREPVFETLSGIPLYLHQLRSLILRQIRYIWFKKISFAILQVLMPIATICLFTIIANNENELGTVERQTSTSLDLDLYRDMSSPRVLYNVNVSGLSLRRLGERYRRVEFKMEPDVANAVLRTGQNDIMEYNKYLVGIELNDTDATVMFTTVVRHAAPVALNLLTNILALQLLPYADGETVTTYNYPIQSEGILKIKKMPKSLIMCATWGFFIAFITLSTVVNAAALPCAERASGARRAHALAGCARALLWGAALLFHALLYTLLLAAPAVALAYLLDTDDTFRRADFVVTAFLVLVLGILSFLSIVYIVSFYFMERGTSVILVVLIFLFGFITPSLRSISEAIGKERGLLDVFIDAIRYTMPPHTLTAAVVQTALTASVNAVDGADYNCYFCTKNYAPGGSMLALFLQCLFYMTIVVLTEIGLFNAIWDRIVNGKYREPPTGNEDDMVRAEKAYVEKAITLPSEQIQDAMLVNNLHKRYWSPIGKSCNAVQGVNFSLKKGECFGLLGVNGAGKSTTFKMLTGLEHPTRGSIFANGHFLSLFSNKYLRSLGYCPQFAGVDVFLTGRQNLELILTLRGLKPSDVIKEAEAWISSVGLERYADRSVSGYSGGCCRRLATAAALCRAGAVTLLDEPTAGVDVAARRRVWAAVRRAAPHRAIIVTSHSLDETEALCSRLAIMVRGRLRVLGSPAALRAAHAAGHAVLFKLTTGTDETDSADSQLNHLKATLNEKFHCTLRDEHKTMLHYHIDETMRYSELFKELEKLKEHYPLIEDYSITETTLEEVFLALAKEENMDLVATV